MAVRLKVTRTGLSVHFSGTDLLAACSRGLFLPYARVLGVRVMTRADAVASSPRLPSPGLWWSQRYRAGCWGVGERRQLWSARRGPHVVVIYLTGRPFHRVVVEVDEPERAHRQIDAALLHSKKTSARRSIRGHRRSVTDMPDPEPAHAAHADQPAHADQRRQRHRASKTDLDRLPAHAAPPRRADSRKQPRTPAQGSASAAVPLPEGQREAGTRARESPSPASVAPPPRYGSATDSGTVHDLAELSAPREIDPSFAARLRLYEYRSSLSRQEHPNRTCLDA